MATEIRSYYLRVYDSQCVKQIGLKKEIVSDFFGIQLSANQDHYSLELIAKKDNSRFDCSISVHTDCRFLSELSSKLKSLYGVINLGDIICFEKRKNGIYVELIKNSQNNILYSSLFGQNSDDIKHVLVSTTPKKDDDFNIIFFGAPGTGKSTEAKRLQKANNFNKTFRTTFHPESDYSSFVGSYKPVSVGNDIFYKFCPQVFMKAYLYAWQNPDEKVCLVIEEINRGNCALIFGDIFQLLDRDAEGYSKYSIDIDEDCATFICESFNKCKFADGSNPILSGYIDAICKHSNTDVNDFNFGQVLLPGNLYLYATMNTSDQSLYPMDSAFKRRWKWRYSPIDYSKISSVKINLSCGIYSWSEFLKKINTRITEITQSEDKQLGQFFIEIDQSEIISEDEFRDKVLFYLWNDIYKDECGTASTIFQIKDTDNQNNSKEFSFSSLYSLDSDKYLEAIMSNLELQKIQ